MLLLDDNPDITEQELEWLDDECRTSGFDWLTTEELRLVKLHNCKQYRKDDCYGCFYYDPEDQVCRFDK